METTTCESEQFGWILVDKVEPVQIGKIQVCGQAYTIGTKEECENFQKMMELTNTTEIVPF